MNHAGSHARVWPWAAALLACGLALSAFSEDPPAAVPPTPWEYAELAWEQEDSLAVLRAVTGSGSLSDTDELLEQIKAEGRDLRTEPLAEAEVQARVHARLAEAGASGWEAYWLREGQLRFGPVLVPTVTVLVKRRAP